MDPQVAKKKKLPKLLVIWMVAQFHSQNKRHLIKDLQSPLRIF